MSCARRRKKLQKPHLALLLLVALGILAQSILAISGETHEFLLHADAGETYAPHAPHQHHGDEEPGHERGALHALLHQTCGTHCVWMPTFMLPAPQAIVAASSMPDDSIGRIPASDLTAPFRPPIPA